MKDCDSQYYHEGVKDHLITNHCKDHTKRIESNIARDGYSVADGCAYRSCMSGAIKWESDGGINKEVTCNKCGWKILYIEDYKNTEKGWNRSDYYYHLWCYKK